MEPHSNAPLFSGVVGSGCLDQDLDPKYHKILPSLKFHDIGNNPVDVQDYVVLSPEARVLCLSIEFDES
jgi:hypothetical protein